MFPVEFSTVAYFAVPIILLMTKRRLHSWAAYSGLMAGFFYYMAMIAAGGMIYGQNPPLDIYISMFCHSSIYFCGFVTIDTEVCSAKDAPKLTLGVAWMAVHAALLRPFVADTSRLLIYILLDAAAVKRVLPESTWPLALLVYYLAVAAFVPVDHSRLLPQKSEAISQISRPASGLIERPAPLTFPSSFPLRIWNRDKKRTYFSGYQYLLLAKPQRRRYSKN